MIRTTASLMLPRQIAAAGFGALTEFGSSFAHSRASLEQIVAAYRAFRHRRVPVSAHRPPIRSILSAWP